jgi:hypothetical protein
MTFTRRTSTPRRRRDEVHLVLCAITGPHAVARAAMLTGSDAQRVGSPNLPFPLSREGLHSNEVTIAELLKTRSYATGSG